MFIQELSGCGVESSCRHLNFRFRACFQQGVSWHSGNYRVWIHSETCTWHDKNIQLGLVCSLTVYYTKSKRLQSLDSFFNCTHVFIGHKTHLQLMEKGLEKFKASYRKIKTLIYFDDYISLVSRKPMIMRFESALLILEQLKSDLIFAQQKNSCLQQNCRIKENMCWLNSFGKTKPFFD